MSKKPIFNERIQILKADTKQWFLVFKNEDKDNEYFTFIQNCQNKEYTVDKDNPLTELHIHHIIPKYLLQDTDEERDFCNSKENLIELSIEDHILAHKILAKLYPNPQNEGAVQLLENAMDFAKKSLKQAGAYASHDVQRAKQIGFFNPDLADEIALKGSQASLARPDAIELRKEAGKVGGKLARACSVVRPEDKYLWYYNGARKGSGTQITEKGEPVCCTFNCSLGSEIVEILNSIYSSNLEKITPVIQGERKSTYGWSCEKIIIPNELGRE